jgi:hypothetical protein
MIDGGANSACSKSRPSFRLTENCTSQNIKIARCAGSPTGQMAGCRHPGREHRQLRHPAPSYRLAERCGGTPIDCAKMKTAIASWTTANSSPSTPKPTNSSAGTPHLLCSNATEYLKVLRAFLLVSFSVIDPYHDLERSETESLPAGVIKRPARKASRQERHNHENEIPGTSAVARSFRPSTAAS